MHHYFAYGFIIASELPLPELLDAAGGRGDGSADVNFRLGTFDATPPAGLDGTCKSWATRDVAMLDFENGSRFLVTGEREVIIDRGGKAADETVRLFLLGAVLGSLLSQRGFLVLHGSSAVIDGQAIAIVADKGTGKSTLAAAFHAAGYGIATDDLVAVDVNAPGGPTMYPGFPQLKLYPEAAAQINLRPEDLPRVSPELEKRSCRAATAFPTQRLPLRRVYSLADGTSEAINTLPPQLAFFELVKHTFTLNMLRATGQETSHFAQAITLARSIPINTLHRRRLLSVLPSVVQLVKSDLAA
jgi:hypothetical protein